MRQRSLVNAVLFAATLTLAALVIWLPADNPDGTAPLTSVNPAELGAFRVEYPQGRDGADRQPLAFERATGGWRLVSPIERRARDERIVTALSVLEAPADSCYPSAEHDPAKFGLTKPKLILHAGDLTLAFGDRAADGRRYLRAGSRLCLVADRTYPLLSLGLDGLAGPALLPGDAVPLRIDAPGGGAIRSGPNAGWRPLRARGSTTPSPQALRRWAAQWRGARATGFVLVPPAADHGRIRIETADGVVRHWRIARPEPELLLVPAGTDYGLSVDPEAARALLRPPAPR